MKDLLRSEEKKKQTIAACTTTKPVDSAIHPETIALFQLPDYANGLVTTLHGLQYTKHRTYYLYFWGKEFGNYCDVMHIYIHLKCKFFNI